MVEHEILDLGVCKSQSHIGCRDCFKTKKKNLKKVENPYLKNYLWYYSILNSQFTCLPFFSNCSLVTFTMEWTFIHSIKKWLVWIFDREMMCKYWLKMVVFKNLCTAFSRLFFFLILASPGFYVFRIFCSFFLSCSMAEEVPS